MDFRVFLGKGKGGEEEVECAVEEEERYLHGWMDGNGEDMMMRLVSQVIY